MSDRARSLPDRPSLEQLRKQAKERLRSLRAAGQTATLADAQHALAREYGFAHWMALVRHVEAVNPPGLRKFEEMAAEIAAAYTSADAQAVREFNWIHGTSFVWHRDVDAMHQQLPTWYASQRRTVEIALQDARHLVARKMGFDHWPALVASLARPEDSPTDSVGRPFYRIQPDGVLEIEGAAADRHWEEILVAMGRGRVTHVSANGLTDDGLRQLVRFQGITRLAIGGAQLTDDGVQHLIRLPHLEMLDLGNPRSRLTDRGLGVLRHLPTLRALSLAWVPSISDAGIAHLAGCDRLERVDLMGTATGDGALKALAGKPALARLATGRLVTDAGLQTLRDFPAFHRPFTGDVRIGLMSFGVETNHLLLDGPFTDRGLSALAGLEGIVGVNLFWHTSGFTAAGLSALQDLPNLAFLGCDGKRCTDEAMGYIARIPGLRMLMAQGTVATDAGFEALSAAPALEYLWTRECPNLTGRGFRALCRVPTLRGLAVSCADVEDDALADLALTPQLTDLLTMDVRDDGFRHVGRCQRLTRLWCMYCREMTDAGMAHLSGLMQLVSFYAGGTRITDRGLEILSRLPELERVELTELAGITDDGVRALARLPRLRELSVGLSPGVSRSVLRDFPIHVRVSYEP